MDLKGVLFVMNRIPYSAETKWKCIEMKKTGYTNKEIQGALNIKNISQVKTWWRWYRKGESHRFDQQVGKQYSYGKGQEELSEVEQLKLENCRQATELEILKKYKEMERSWYQKSL